MVIETAGLTKIYPGGGGCRDISLEVGAGEVFGFLGPNGAGKSTLVKMLVGLLFPTSGSALILGRPLGDHRARKAVGFLPENFRYHAWLATGELLEFHGALAELSPREIKSRIPEVLELTGLSGTERKMVSAFSKGMQQRLGLAAALLSRPRLLFLDEPTSALDPVGRMEMRQLIQNLREEGVTVFLNSHLLSEVERVCSRVGVIRDGQLRATGELTAMLQSSLEVELEVGEIDENLLAQLRPLVKSLRRDGLRLLMEVEGREDLPLLARAVLESGHSLYAMEPRRTSLEDLFLEMMADEGRSQGNG